MPRRFFVTLLLAAACGFVFMLPGCDELVTETIEVTIAGNPTAEFAINPDSGCIPLTVDFDDASSGPVIKWIWNFGDSVRDTLWADSGDIGDISHTYTQPGTYTVTLSVFDSIDGSDSETKKRAVVVGHNIDSLTLSDTLGCPGQDFAFTAHNPYGVATWRWDFGDGTVSTDTSLTQIHSYVDPGIYEFELTVTGDCGQKVLIDSVHILNCAAPYFTADPKAGCVPFTVVFVDSSGPAIDSSGGNYDTVGIIVHWSWDFGNGETREYDLPTDTIDIEYTDSGTYEVTLAVTTDSGGVSSYSETISAWPEVSADFTAAPLAGCQTPGRQFIVAFKREATGDTAWTWDFGDGDSAFIQNPYHAYTTPGVYSVTLEVLGACGAEVTSISQSDMIHLSDQLNEITLSLSADTVMIDSILTASDLSPIAAIVYRSWDFGDESVVTDTSAVLDHTYTQEGSYWVTLTRSNSCDTLVDSAQIVVIPPPAP